MVHVSQSVSYFTVPPRAHPSTGSQSGSATPGLWYMYDSFRINSILAPVTPRNARPPPPPPWAFTLQRVCLTIHVTSALKRALLT